MPALSIRLAGLLVFSLSMSPYAEAQDRLPKGETPHRWHTIHNVIDGNSTIVLKVESTGEGMGNHFFASKVALQLPNGHEYVLDKRQTIELPRHTEVRLSLPDGRRTIYFESGNAATSDTPQTFGQLTFPNAKVTYGSKSLSVCMGKPLKPQFESKEGRAFRAALPDEPMELMDVLQDARGLLQDASLINGFSEFFIDLYHDTEDPIGRASVRAGWELVEVKRSVERLSPGEVPWLPKEPPASTPADGAPSTTAQPGAPSTAAQPPVAP